MKDLAFKDYRDRVEKIASEFVQIINNCEKAAKRRGLDVTTILEFSRVINSSNLDIYKLEALAINTLKGHLMVSEARFLRQAIFNPDRISERPSLRDEGKEPITFDLKDPFIRALCVNPAILNLDDAPKSLSQKDARLLTDQKISLIVPLLPKEDYLIGMVLLGLRMDKRTLNPDEMEMLEGLCSILATALQNAYLYKQQERKIEELEKQLPKS